MSFCPSVPDPWAACPGEVAAKGRTQGTSVLCLVQVQTQRRAPGASEARPGLGALTPGAALPGGA